MQLLSVSGRFLLVLLLLLTTFVFAMFQGGKVSWTIFYIILPFVIYSTLLFLYPLNDFKAERAFKTRTLERGGKLEIRISLNRRIPFPLLYTVVAERWENPSIARSAGAAGKRLFLFGFRRHAEWTYEIGNMPRGEHLLLGIEVDVSDFFGWVRKTKMIELNDRVLVLPKTEGIEYIPIKAQYDRGSITSPFALVKDTTMATGVRQYQPGDRVTWIHWKSFARTQSLMTKEFEDRQSEELLVVLDGRASELIEEEIELAASIVKEASADQAVVSFATVSDEIHEFPSVQTVEQMREVLVHLAKLHPAGDAALNQKENAAFQIPVTGSVVLVTSDPEWAFIQPLFASVKPAKEIICFTVVDRNKPSSQLLEERMRVLQAKGIRTLALGKTEFAGAFREVASL